MKKRIECDIVGKVQGVFFRDLVKKNADRLGLSGFARNELDGSVLVVAEGEEGKLKQFLELIKQGTEYSNIEKVEESWQNPTGEFSDFGIKF